MHHTPCRPAADIRCSTCVTSAMQRAQDGFTSPHTLLTCKPIITQDKRVQIQNKNSFAARSTVPLLDCTSMISEMILGSYADTDTMVRLARSREAFQLRLFHKAGELEAYPRHLWQENQTGSIQVSVLPLTSIRCLQGTGPSPSRTWPLSQRGS